MEKDNIFFAEKGLTSTSANHIANLAKEWIQSIENSLNVSFVSEDITLIGGTATQSLKKGIGDTFFFSLKDKLQAIADAKSLIAWLREAIKARQSLINDVEELTLSEYFDTLPEKPAYPDLLNEDKYIASLSIKDRNRYYSLETKCAVIGKYIHPDGQFARARKAYYNALKEPSRADGSGRDTVIRTYTPTVSETKLESAFFELQKEHREAQAELNSIKFLMEKAITDDSIAKKEKYNEELASYNRKVEEMERELTLYKEKEIQRISSLKIVIPNNLLAVYEEVSKA